MNNNHENLICPVCRTVNISEYRFCKNCGTPLSQDTEAQGGSAQYTPPPNFRGGYNYSSHSGNYYAYSQPYTDYSAVEPSLDDVDTKKIQAYVGPSKQDYFMRLFITMKRLGRKLFVNWPIAIMGTLLATPFAASWFFYRKMYKIGTIICLSCLLLSCLSTALTYSATTETINQMLQETSHLSDQEFADYISTNFESEDEGYSYTYLVAYAVQLISLGGVLYLSLSGNYLYYKHITGKIKKLDANGPPKDLFFYSIQGRPSSLMAVLIPFCFATLSAIISFIPYAGVILSGVSPQRLVFLLSLIK